MKNTEIVQMGILEQENDALRAERDALRAQVARLRKIGQQISNAHESGNNGAFMGEAILCEAFARELRAALSDIPTPDNTCPKCNGGGRATESVEDERPCPVCNGKTIITPDINAEMLEAIKEVVYAGNIDNGTHSVVDAVDMNRLRAIIAKAERMK